VVGAIIRRRLRTLLLLLHEEVYCLIHGGTASACALIRLVLILGSVVVSSVIRGEVNYVRSSSLQSQISDLSTVSVVVHFPIYRGGVLVERSALN
jgi:hypothetical protein